MKTKNYEKFVRDFWNAVEPAKLDLAVAGLGLAGEAGEAVEYIKKFASGRHAELKTDKLFDELGDSLYYITVILCKMGYNLNDLMYHNVNKLGARFERSVSEYIQ